MKKVKIGDIVEIAVGEGFAYAQYTHKHKTHGALIRVFENVYRERPQINNEFLSQNIRFSTFIPLQAAINKEIFNIVANKSVRPDLARFPIFRAGVVDPSIGKVSTWWLWDGKKEWKIGKLSKDQIFLPIRGVWNDTMLIKRIESGWRPEKDATT